MQKFQEVSSSSTHTIRCYAGDITVSVSPTCACDIDVVLKLLWQCTCVRVYWPVRTVSIEVAYLCRSDVHITLLPNGTQPDDHTV